MESERTEGLVLTSGEYLENYSSISSSYYPPLQWYIDGGRVQGAEYKSQFPSERRVERTRRVVVAGEGDCEIGLFFSFSFDDLEEGEKQSREIWGWESREIGRMELGFFYNRIVRYWEGRVVREWDLG